MARLHLLLPSLMCGGMLLGVLVAVAHHLFYHSLNGRIVPSDNQQQWFFRIGTGLAFLTKTFLTGSAALAYTQILWQTLRSRPISLHGVDSLFSAVTNAWSFTDVDLWRSGPTLAIVALIIWTLPLISVITPATLTVRPAVQPNQTIYNVPIPSIDYGRIDAQKFALLNSGGPTGYIGPAQRVVRLLASITSQGSILQIAAPYPNCTYSIPFYGPSLSCGPTTTGNASFQEDVWKLINNYTCPQGTCHGIEPFYIGFVPQYSGTTLSDAVLIGLNMTLNSPNNIQTGSEIAASGATLDQVSTDHARFYATTLKAGAPSNDGVNGISYSASAYETIECGLYNTSYVVNFTFNNGLQNITVTNITQLNGVDGNQWFRQCGVAEGTCSGPAMAYYSIMDALDNQMIGFLQTLEYGQPESIRTQITNTVLMETTEIQDNMGFGYRQPLSIVNTTLGKALEQSVLNATLSLFSDSYFLQNSTVASIQPVLVSSPQNAYLYSSRNLLIAYGIGIFITGIIVMVGIVCIWASGNSFGASFSTILRTTRNIQLDAAVQARETEGAFPLSKQLGETKLILRRYEDTRTAFAVADTAGGGDELTALGETWAKRRASFDSQLETTQFDTVH